VQAASAQDWKNYRRERSNRHLKNKKNEMLPIHTTGHTVAHNAWISYGNGNTGRQSESVQNDWPANLQMKVITGWQFSFFGW
jgi:hypothetical protein